MYESHPADPHQAFASQLAQQLHQSSPDILRDDQFAERVLIRKSDKQYASFDLTPFKARTQAVSARGLFSDIHSLQGLIERYYQARSLLPFEESLPIYQSIDSQARLYVMQIFEQAKGRFSDDDATRIAGWIRNLDIYTAVKSIESLLHSKADIALLKLTEEQKWNLHFDHLAIRCGSSANNSAEQVRDLLVNYHGYTTAQMPDADYYHFDDGWSAYLLYKILENGQVLRLFIDQSDEDHPEQVIQHWNYIYGFTAHHLAMRMTVSNKHTAISLQDATRRLENKGIGTLTPTGLYTHGMLEQVFTQPEQDMLIRPEIRQRLESINTRLVDTLKNGKLLEIVSRVELPEQFKPAYFELYGLNYNPDNPLHSVPVYEYFLPAQAAHVIRTSTEMHH